MTMIAISISAPLEAKEHAAILPHLSAAVTVLRIVGAYGTLRSA